MRIYVNGKEKNVKEGFLSEIMIELGYSDLTVATAVNEHFVPVASRAETKLTDNCRVEILSPQQGG